MDAISCTASHPRNVFNIKQNANEMFPFIALVLSSDSCVHTVYLMTHAYGWVLFNVVLVTMIFLSGPSFAQHVVQAVEMKNYALLAFVRGIHRWTVHSPHKLQVMGKAFHDDVIKWKHFPRYWPFVRGIHRSPVNSPHKGQWRGAFDLHLNKQFSKQS